MADREDVDSLDGVKAKRPWLILQLQLCQIDVLVVVKPHLRSDDIPNKFAVLLILIVRLLLDLILLEGHLVVVSHQELATHPLFNDFS